MPSLLLELLSEEIPARMQAQAARDLERMARERLAAAELTFHGIRSFAGPRRLTLAVDGLPYAQADRREERKGPRANAPEQALAGFLRSTGLTREQLTERDGVFYATTDTPGRPTPQIVAEMVEQIVHAFPWPKSMRWGAGALRWVRPLKRIVCTFDGAVVPFEIELGGGAVIGASNLTEGHRFMGVERAPFGVSGFEDYAERLADRYVVLDPAERRARIAAGCRAVCEARGLEWVQDEGLLDEVVGLAEWPVPILGDMDPRFLDLPPEVIRTSMRVHQRYFAVRDPATGALAPHFVVVANIEPRDGGAVIAHGNARVLTARLADARFFWDEDRRPGAFERWGKKLQGVTFHAKLGTMAERVERIAALAREIAPLVGADPELAETAARLCKLDLASGMVGEFPELQGVMGGYYARSFPLEGGRAGLGVGAPPPEGSPVPDGGAASDQSPTRIAPTPIPDPSPLQGEGSLADLTPAEIAQVADAVRDHYKPLGPSDSVPVEPVTVAVALADKLDTLVGFFAIDERPTGSKDPYALRRAALGVIRLLLANEVRLSTGFQVQEHMAKYFAAEIRTPGIAVDQAFDWALVRSQAEVQSKVVVGTVYDSDGQVSALITACSPDDLLAFFADRLKVLLREEGKRHDLVDAVFALGDDDLVRIVRRVEALSAFLATEDGASPARRLQARRQHPEAPRRRRRRARTSPRAGTSTALAEPAEQALSASLRTVQGEVEAGAGGGGLRGRHAGVLAFARAGGRVLRLRAGERARP